MADLIPDTTDGGHPYLTLIVVCLLVISGGFVCLYRLFHSRMKSGKWALPARRGALVGYLISVFIDSLAAGYLWFVKKLPFVVAAVGLVIACWGLRLSIISCDPLDFSRSGALITLLGFVIGFLKSLYAKGVYQAESAVDPKEAEQNRVDIMTGAEDMATIWGLVIIVPGTLIWGYGDLISTRVEKYACDHKLRLAVQCCAPAPVHPPPPQKLLILFDWNSASLQSAAEGIIFDVAQDASKDANSSVHLVGHADASGRPEHNLALSKRRACAVRSELLKLGLNRTQITTSFAGSSDPLVSPDANGREALNRNVEVVIDYSSAATRGP